MTRGRQDYPRFRIYPEFRAAVRERMRAGESARWIALVGLFPSPSVFSSQLHATGIPKSDLNLNRWKRVAVHVRYGGPMFEEIEQ